MRNYLIRRVLQAIPTILGVTLIAFFLTRAAPGDPVDLMFDPNLSNEVKAELRQAYCLDRSVIEQYAVWWVGDWLGQCRGEGIIRGDWGTSLSIQTGVPVFQLFLQRAQATFELATAALIIGVLIGLPVGIGSAVRRGKLYDNVSRFLSVVFDAIPAFWFGLMLIVLFGRLGWLPTYGRMTPDLETGILWDRISHLILPAIVLAVGWIALLSRLMRTEMLEVLRSDYIKTAHAKGLPFRQVNYRHAARTALIPIATVLGPGLAGLLSGAVVVEQIFAWPGIGRMTFSAVTQRDYPVVMASVVITAVIVIIGNLLSDVLYAIIDPRVRLK